MILYIGREKKLVREKIPVPSEGNPFRGDIEFSRVKYTLRYKSAGLREAYGTKEKRKYKREE